MSSARSAVRVSIVTPTLNPGELAPRVVHHVKDLGGPAVEHIVVDGGSSDGTAAYLRSQQDIVAISEPDRGQADALRKGFELASGEIVGWLNADDTLDRKGFWRSVELLSTGDAAWVCGDVVIEDEIRGLRTTYAPPRRLQPWHFMFGNPIAQPGSLYLRRAVEAGGGIDPSFDYAMDHDLFLRLHREYGQPLVVRSPVATFPVHARSKSGSIPRSHFLEEMARSMTRSGPSGGEVPLLARSIVSRAYEQASPPSTVAEIAHRLAGAPPAWWDGPQQELVKWVEYELDLECLRRGPSMNERAASVSRLVADALRDSLLRLRLRDAGRRVRRSFPYLLGAKN